MQKQRASWKGPSVGFVALSTILLLAACGQDQVGPTTAASRAPAPSDPALGGDCRFFESAASPMARERESEAGARCGNGRIAESVMPVVNGQYFGQFQIKVLRADGRGTIITDQPYGALDPEWDRTGSRIYYWAPTDGPDGLFWVDPAGGPSTQLHMDGSDDPNYLGDDSPAISPSGLQLLTARAYGPFDGWGGYPRTAAIYEMGIDGSHAFALTHPAFAFEDHAPRWSPRGDRVLFQRLSDETGISTIWIVNADGSDPHPLGPSALDSGDPDWSPDGELIVFQSPAEADGVNTQQIYAMRGNGTHVVQLTRSAADASVLVKNYHARFSPDGRRIVFGRVDGHTTVGPDGLHHADLFIMDRDGGDLVRVTSGPEKENSPAWGPRGY